MQEDSICGECNPLAEDKTLKKKLRLIQLKIRSGTLKSILVEKNISMAQQVFLLDRKQKRRSS